MNSAPAGPERHNDDTGRAARAALVTVRNLVHQAIEELASQWLPDVDEPLERALRVADDALGITEENTNG